MAPQQQRAGEAARQQRVDALEGRLARASAASHMAAAAGSASCSVKTDLPRRAGRRRGHAAEVEEQEVEAGQRHHPLDRGRGRRRATCAGRSGRTSSATSDSTANAVVAQVARQRSAPRPAGSRSACSRNDSWLSRCAAPRARTASRTSARRPATRARPGWPAPAAAATAGTAIRGRATSGRAARRRGGHAPA